MLNLKTILTIIMLILIGSNTYFGFAYFEAQKEIQQNQSALETQKINKKILEFTDLFIKNILQSETEIDLETRLNLENLVRDLDDQPILEQWKKFTETKTPIKAQKEVKNLLELLISKIKT